ncbi:MAG: DUF1599 domain-containing protein [Oscillospiraceae bacterium]|jgi:hypothetical protein|nr:DUF1599 domain-containing protein [Oscillospiraceae bacterium]
MSTSFDRTLGECRGIFASKLMDYGPTWLVFRWVSLVDQIFIKLTRLRTLEETGGDRLVEDTPGDEYRGVINYCLVGLMKWEGRLPAGADVLAGPEGLDAVPAADILAAYDRAAAQAKALLARKNHDYGEAWRSMAPASITDQMLIKTLRLKHMLASDRQLAEANSLPAQLMDILNYCLFGIELTRGHFN